MIYLPSTNFKDVREVAWYMEYMENHKCRFYYHLFIYSNKYKNEFV